MTRHDPCQAFEEQLTSYQLGDLPAGQADKVRAHLEQCERCRASLQELEPTLDILQDALAADVSVPMQLDPARRERIHQVPRRGVFLDLVAQPRAWANMAAALLILGVLVALLVPTVQNAMFQGRMVSDESLGRLALLEDSSDASVRNMADQELVWIRGIDGTPPEKPAERQ